MLNQELCLGGPSTIVASGSQRGVTARYACATSLELGPLVCVHTFRGSTRMERAMHNEISAEMKTFIEECLTSKHAKEDVIKD